MKKIMILAFGFSLFAAGLTLSSTEASRDAYHAYQFSGNQFYDYRHFTEARSQRVLRQATRNKRRSQITNYAQPRNFRGSRFNTSDQGIVNPNLPRRSSTSRTSPHFSTQTIRTSSRPTVNLASQGVRQVRHSFATVENDEFSILLPTGWELKNSDEEVQLYGKTGESYRVRVKHFTGNVCATDGFTSCAIKLSKAENYLIAGAVGRLAITSKIERSSRAGHAVLNRLDIQNKTYTEQFNAGAPFPVEKTITRYFVGTPDGGAFMVEATAPYREAAAYAETTKRVFDSFRMYAQ